MVEVMVAILILTIAILPMAAMFTTGLDSLTKSSGYDKARALANAQLEKGQNLSKTTPAGWATLNSTSFPVCAGGSGPTSMGSGNSTATNCTDPDAPGYTFDLKKQYVQFDPAGATGADLQILPSTTDQKMMQLTVTVHWRENSYKTTRMVFQA